MAAPKKKHAKHKHLVLKKTSSGKSRWMKPKGSDKKPSKKRKSKEKASLKSAFHSFNHLRGGMHDNHSPSDGHAYVQRQRDAIAKLRKAGKTDEAAKKQAALNKFLSNVAHK